MSSGAYGLASNTTLLACPDGEKVGKIMETATLERVSQQDLLRFVDQWLDDNSWKLDAAVIDFALDIRQMVADLDD